MATRNDFSAGGIATTDRGDIALITNRNREGRSVVGLPKGHPEKDESPLMAALREVQEETGFTVEPIDGAAPVDIEYWFRNKKGDLVHKKVVFFCMRVTGGSTEDRDHDEVDEVLLVDRQTALETLTYENERTALARAQCG